MRHFQNPSKIINHVDQVELFLIDNGIKNETISNVLKDMRCIANANHEVMADDNAYAVYARITPIKIAPQALYGSTVPSESVNLLSVCKSKLVGSELLPDEDNVLFSAMIPERSLSALMFGRNTDVGEPITFTNFNGKTCPKYVSEYTTEFDYMMLTENHQQSVKDDIEAITDAIEPFIANPSSLKVAEIKDIFGKASRMSSYAHYRCQHEVKDIVEKMGSNALDLRHEISATTNGYLTKIAKHVEIENKQSHKDSQLESMCRIASDHYRADIKDFLKEYEAVIPEHVSSFLESLSCPTSQDTIISDQISQGYCTLNQIYGNSQQLFCDKADRLTASDHEDIRQLCIGYSIATDSITSTKIRFTPQVELARLSLTNYQTLSLLQSALSNNWTKATLARYSGVMIEHPDNKNNVDADSFGTKYKELRETFSVDYSDADIAVKELSNTLSNLCQAGVRSKASKQEFLEIIQKMIGLMPDVMAHKKNNIRALSEDMSLTIREDLTKFIGDICTEHPELGTELLKLTVKK